MERAIEAVRPKNLIKKSLKIKDNILWIKNDSYNLKIYEKILIIGGGKATAEMSLILEKIFLDYAEIKYQGLVNIPERLEINTNSTTKILFNYASHPIPNENGHNGTKSMMKFISKATSKDLIFCLISEGGSALLPLPKGNITITDLQKVNSLLLASGASINEINVIRKHLSDIKGGNLAKKVYEASGSKIISLIISDVVGDNLDTIASGPTVPDVSTFKEAMEILIKYNIIEKIPSSVKSVLEEGLNDNHFETPKPSDACFNNVHNYLIGSVRSAADEVATYLKKQNYKVDYFSNEIVGEARDFGINLYQIINQKIIDYKDHNKISLIGTGELTVTIKGRGIGGRNQEMLLTFLDFIKEKDIDYNYLIISTNLDGIEGNSNAMGALIDNFTISQVLEKQLDAKNYLDNNDSNGFFKKLDCEIISGPTGCNVNDLLIVLIIQDSIEN